MRTSAALLNCDNKEKAESIMQPASDSANLIQSLLI